jgi:hypothetical protein
LNLENILSSLPLNTFFISHEKIIIQLRTSSFMNESVQILDVEI